MTDDDYTPQPGSHFGWRVAQTETPEQLTARIAALEAQVTAADELAEAWAACQGVPVEVPTLSDVKLFVAVDTALAAYRAAKGE